MYQTYSNSKLYDIAKDNYNRLVKFCNELNDEGYWDNPKIILNQSIHEVLDRYIQAILISLTIYNGRMTEDEYHFIRSIPINNLIPLSESCTVEDETKKQAQKIVNSPPILIQLCGLRDSEKKCNTASSFFEALLNILLAMSYLNNENDLFVSVYIQEFYRKVSAFIQSEPTNCQTENRENRFNLINLDKNKSNIHEQINYKDYTEDDNKVIVNSNKIKIHVPKIEELRKEKEELIKEKEKLREEKDELFKKKENQEVLIKPKQPYEKYDHNSDSLRSEVDSNQSLIYKENEDNIQKMNEQIEEENRKMRLNALLEELNDLTGLSSVKDEINSLINLIKVRKLRESYHMPIMDMSYHMVFTGNPGTGKTTVARLIAKIYKELGFLTEGTLIETDRAGLVAGFVGQTAIKVKEVVEKAIGGVLFIDEAYTLSSGIKTNDYGAEAIDTLVKLMEDNRDNLVVIVAGYNEEMKEFLKSNTGLVSRFNKFIEFKDYSVEELMEILENNASKNRMSICEEAKELIKEDLVCMSKERRKTFGNARGMRNVFEKIVVNQANRIVVLEAPSIKELEEILLVDVMNVIV